MSKDNNILEEYWIGSITQYDIIESQDKYEYKTSDVNEEIVKQKVEMMSSDNIEVDYSELETEVT